MTKTRKRARTLLAATTAVVLVSLLAFYQPGYSSWKAGHDTWRFLSVREWGFGNTAIDWAGMDLKTHRDISGRCYIHKFGFLQRETDSP